MLVDFLLGILVVVLVVARYVGFYGLMVGSVSLLLTVASIVLAVDRLPVRDTDVALAVSAVGTAICGLTYIGSFYLTDLIAANIGWHEPFVGLEDIPLATPVLVVVALAAAVYVHRLAVEARRPS